MSRFSRAIAVFVVSVLGVGAAPASGAQAKRADHRLDRALHQLVARDGGPPGAAALVDREGRVDFHRAGVGIVSSGRPIRRRDHLRIASVAKAFSGAVALGLVDRGVLSLDSTIGQVLPELPAAWSQVTLREVLAHTSGLPEYIRSPEFIERLTANPRQYISPQELIGFVADQPLVFAPGSRYEYADTDNIVVALMCEAATGVPYEELIQRLVDGPIGLRGTSLPSGFLMPRPYVHGYFVKPGTPPENQSQELSASGAWASGGIVSTSSDLNRFVRAYARGGLFGSAVRAEQLQFIPGGTSGPPGPGRNSAGLAIFRYETSCGVVYGHTGNFPGYTVMIAATPDGSRSVVFLVNAQFNPEHAPAEYRQMRRAESRAVCAALA